MLHHADSELIESMIGQHRHSTAKTLIFTSLALTAFAANSVLCRFALGQKTIDALSFTVIRLISGAIVLLAMISINRNKTDLSSKGSWSASLMLFFYAITFSFAYISLDTGTGALILFGSVQITMILLFLVSGNRLHFTEWIGVVTAFTGFVYLISPGVTSPSLLGFVLMTVSGSAWGIYTLKGRSSINSISDTAYNFFRIIPLVLVLAIMGMNQTHLTSEGILLATLSGGIASGIGYTIWYSALGGLSATQAAVSQLLVPIIAAFGGVIFVSETLTLRLLISATIILGGILIVGLGRYFLSHFDFLSKT